MSLPSKFDYSTIPEGYYDKVLQTGHPIRKMWHQLKFDRVRDFLPSKNGGSILDIGCFAGSFLGRLPENQFSRQVGFDILKPQIDYANSYYGTPFRHFAHGNDLSGLGEIKEVFDCVTLIEVIEHLTEAEIRFVWNRAIEMLKPGGQLIITTPNYTSAWPLVEWILNKFSDVKYEEQHLTKFNYFTAISRLANITGSLGLVTNECKTTSHFITPFIAGLSESLSQQMAAAVPHRRWAFPFGNLLLLVFRKK